jgi:cell division protein FtsQ
MPRKTYEGMDLLPGMEPADSAPRPRARVSVGQARPPSRLKIALRVMAFTLILALSLYAFHRVEQFLIRDSRFALGGDGSTDASTLDIQGAEHASRRAIETVFAEDLGRSVYLLPLADRRATLQTVDWVKDASVARLWPNRVVVRVTERQPVAFLTLGPSRFGLIDADGVILPQSPGRFHLPVLTGVQTRDSVPERRAKVQRMLHLLSELGGMADKLSEIDVSDRDNLKVTQPYEGRMVTLLLGDQDFGVRYQNFVSHYGEIKQKLPGATTLDLRLEDRITVVNP